MSCITTQMKDISAPPLIRALVEVGGKLADTQGTRIMNWKFPTIAAPKVPRNTKALSPPIVKNHVKAIKRNKEMLISIIISVDLCPENLFTTPDRLINSEIAAAMVPAKPIHAERRIPSGWVLSNHGTSR